MVILNGNNIHINTLNDFNGLAFYKTSKSFMKNNRLHRYYGPAVIYKNSIKYWIFNDKTYNRNFTNYNQKQFIKDLNKQWLL